MKKYRVSGTGIHAIKLSVCKLGRKKINGVTWFESLEDAKNQVLKNRQDAINELLAEKQRLLKQLETIESHINIMSKPIDLDVITDDFLMRSNARMEELNDKIHLGENVF